MHRFTQGNERQGRCAEALERTRQALQCDPYQEESHLLAMRCYGALGDRRGLMRQYEALTDLLREEFDVAPLPQTEEVYLALLRQLQARYPLFPLESST